MFTWHFDQQYRLDSPPPSHPLYYWTNDYSWLQADGVTPDNDIVTNFVQGCRYCIPQQTTQVDWRVTAPDGSFIWPLGPTENSGLAPFYDPAGVLGLCLLVDFFSAGKRVGYKRYRGPWSDSLVLGTQWDSALVSYFDTSVIPNLMVNPLCNRQGIAFDDYFVRSTIYMWQQRHGTKRRSRPVFVLP